MAIQELLHMESFFSDLVSPRLLKAVLGLALLHVPIEAAPEKMVVPPEKQEIHNTPSIKGLDQKKDTYTIKFGNVSIIEYIKFTSKITGLNFFYDEADLPFNISIVSEEPVTAANLISILIQVLRIHGLVVLEQDNSLLITKVRSVSQLATVVSSDLPDVKTLSPLVTRIFRIKNANINTVATVIKPMLSDSALVEVSPETKQLIITDITTNVDKISTLLATIDAPHSTLEIDTFVAQNGDVETLIKVATQIMTPFTEGNPLLFVPHIDTGTIFIISTPYLIERTLTVLEDLDNPSRTKEGIQGQSILLYPLAHKSPDDFMAAAKDLAKQLHQKGAAPKLIECLNEAKVIKESNSILFVADDTTLTKLKTLLPTIDISALGMPNKFFVYKIQKATEEEIQNSLDSLAEDLQKSPQPDRELIDALTSVKYIQEAHSLVFTGSNTALAKIGEILPNFDVVTVQAQEAKQAVPTQFLVYHPKYISGEHLEKALHDLTKNLKEAGLADAVFLKSVETAKWTPSTNSLLFTGNPETLTRLQTLLESLDGGGAASAGGAPSPNFYLYKLKNSPGDTIIHNLNKVAADLDTSHIPNQALIATLHQVKWIKDNNSLLLTGSGNSIEQAKVLIEQFDILPLSSPETHKSAFLIYKPLHEKPQVLKSNLHDMSQNLHGSGLIDPDLLLTLNTLRYVESTQSLLFTGSPESLKKVQEILTQIDVTSPGEAQIQHLGEATFFIYKIEHLAPAQLISAIKTLGIDLEQAHNIDKETVKSIEDVKWIKETNSLLFTGPEATLKIIETMVKKLDAPEPAPGEGAAATTFIVYTPRFQPGEELISILQEFAKNLMASGVSNKALFDTITNLKYVPRTCSLIVSGDPDSIAKIDELLRRFDVPTSETGHHPSAIESIQNTSFLIYKLQYHQGSEILSALKQIATDLTPGTAVGNQNLLSAINSLQWIRVTNSLLASGEAETLSKIRDLVQNLDVPLRQVFIEILVVQTNLLNTQNFGLQWGGKMQFLNKFAAGTGNFPLASNNLLNNPLSSATNAASQAFQTGINAVNASTFPSSGNIPFMSGFDLGVIGDIIMHKGRSFISLGSLVNALQTDSDSTIVMNPKIITQDNRTSTIFVGNNVPFVGSLVTTNSQIVSSSSNIEYRDIGFNLTLTPTIGNNDIVTLDISNDISAIVNQNLTIGTTVNNNNVQIPIQGIETSHTSMQTRVHVPNQHFVILSGMIQDQKARFRSAIPCLGGLPVIGVIFSENDRIDLKQNILIFMRPHIVNTYDEYRAITESQEAVFKENAVLPVLKEEIDAGIDIVKKPQD
jgi:type II secretory pathway component GspD/PulD (secretin)